MMHNYCCSNDKCKNDSKAMCSVDYDSLIENLTHTRNEIDGLIKTLEARKNKDKAINDILSSDYEEKKEADEELKELLKDIMEKDIDEIIGKYPNKKTRPHTYTTKLTYPYRYYPYYLSTYPYDTVWF